MLLYEYLAKQKAAGETGTISRLVRDAEVANSTIHDILNGHRLSRLEVAQRISDATKGKVSVADLMLREQPKRRRASRRAEAA